MTGATVITWGQSVPGREAKGLEVFGKALAHFEGLAKQGRIQGHKEYFALTGRVGGTMVVEGEVDELAKILTEEDTIRLNAEAAAIVQDFAITLCAGGSDQAVGQTVTQYQESLRGLGYMQ